VKVCIPCESPGGPDAAIATPFEETGVLDYYDVHPDGMFEHSSQMRICGVAACIDPVDAIVGRKVDAVIVISLSPSSLMKLHNGGIRVLVTDNPSVRSSLDLLASGKLQELTMDRFAELGNNKR
jgi:predicted Fe-Mo cluster-binding NifX family protein